MSTGDSASPTSVWRDPRVLALVIIQAVVGSGFALLIPALPAFVRSVGGDPSDIGLFNASYAIALLIASPVWGSWSDRVGRRTVLLVGTIGLAISYALLPLAPSMPIALAIRFLGGVMAAATIPASFAYVADVTTLEMRGRAMGALSAGMGIAFIVSPVIGGTLAEFGLGVLFALASLTALSAAILVAKVLPAVPPRAGLASDAAGRGRLRAALRPLWPILCVTFLIGLAESIRPTALALYGSGQVGLGSAELGVVFSVMGLAFVLTQIWLVGPVIERAGERWAIALGQPMTIAGMLLMTVAGDLALVVLANGLQGMGMAFGFTAIPVYISRITSHGQGTAMGYRTSTQSLAQVCGPLVASATYAMGPAVPFVVSAALVLGAMIAALVTLRPVPVVGSAQQAPLSAASR